MTKRKPPAPLAGPVRAAQTKRLRTRQLILSAVEDLLSARSYDDIRVADIAEHAGVGAATFYTVFGDKAGAVSELLLALYEPVERATRRDIETGAWPSDLILAAHLLRIADFVHGHRPLVRGFLRVYGSDVLAKVDDLSDNPVRRFCSITQQLVDDIATPDPSVHPRLWIGDLGTYWTIDLLLAVLAHPPDYYRDMGEKLLLTYLPNISLDEAWRLAGFTTAVSPIRPHKATARSTRAST